MSKDIEGSRVFIFIFIFYCYDIILNHINPTLWVMVSFSFFFLSFNSMLILLYVYVLTRDISRIGGGFPTFFFKLIN